MKKPFCVTSYVFLLICSQISLISQSVYCDEQHTNASGFVANLVGHQPKRCQEDDKNYRHFSFSFPMALTGPYRPAVHMSYVHQPSHLFHVSNLSVITFEFVCPCIRGPCRHPRTVPGRRRPVRLYNPASHRVVPSAPSPDWEGAPRPGWPVLGSGHLLGYLMRRPI